MAALAPLIVIAVAYIGYCITDIVRQPKVRYLPKPAWAVITVISIPLGGALYLLLGRPGAQGRDGRDG